MATPAPIQQVDPWLDQYTVLGNSDTYFEELPEILAEQQAGLDPSDPNYVPDAPQTPKPAEEPDPEPQPEPVVVAPPPPPPVPVEPEVEQPRVTTFEDGSSLSVEKNKKGWKAVLDTNIPGVNPETFYGNTKDELYTRIAAGKVNATKKIRELNRKTKLGENTVTTPTRVAPITKATLRDLTPDEIFEYKTLHESNPQAALDYFNEKRYGLKPQEFAQKLNEGTTARNLGDIESVARTFVSTNPDYLPTGNNFLTIVKYLVRTHFGRGISPTENLDQLTIDLLESGVWTVDNLEDAKNELLASELLEVRPASPVAPEPTPAPVVQAQPTPVPQPAPTPVPQPVAPPVEPVRIAPTPAVRTRPGNLGIRVAETTRTPVTVETPVPDEDMSNWTDTAVEEAMKIYRLNKAKNR
jgi:hypothetical protein